MTPRHLGIVAVSAEGAALCYRHLRRGRRDLRPPRASRGEPAHDPAPEGPVYPTKLAARGIAHDIPDPADRTRIDQVIFDDLVYGRLEDAARRDFASVIAKGRTRGCDAVVLGCTEIPLLIDDTVSSLPTLDSTRILARAALTAATRTA